MNAIDLKALLEQQRARRNAAGSPLLSSRPRPRRDAGYVVSAVAALIMFFVIGYGLAAAYLPGDHLSLLLPAVGTPDREALDAGTPDAGTPATETLDTEALETRTSVPSPTPWTMTVCESVTWLHVRFGPGRNAEVRGYLRGGETVTLTERKGNWALLSAPVAGWADMRYLCGGQP